MIREAVICIAILVIAVSSYGLQHYKWETCSFPIDLWKLGYDLCMGAAVIAIILLTGSARLQQRRRAHIVLLAICLPSFQTLVLIYLIWGTGRVASVVENEGKCVFPI
jgi:hypothetical protein